MFHLAHGQRRKINIKRSGNIRKNQVLRPPRRPPHHRLPPQDPPPPPLRHHPPPSLYKTTPLPPQLLNQCPVSLMMAIRMWVVVRIQTIANIGYLVSLL